MMAANDRWGPRECSQQALPNPCRQLSRRGKRGARPLTIIEKANAKMMLPNAPMMPQALSGLSLPATVP
jgi:hypothetical protein